MDGSITITPLRLVETMRHENVVGWERPHGFSVEWLGEDVTP